MAPARTMTADETTNMTLQKQVPSRRRVAAALGWVGLAAAGATWPRVARAQAVPWSTGTNKPEHPVPPDTCDCHHHIYDRRYPAHPSSTLLPADALPDDYRKFQERIGNRRHVVVQPSTYGTDNRLLVDALGALGPSARGVAVVDAKVADDELMRLHTAGVRGVRFNLSFLVGVTPEMMEPVARRIGPLGWHLVVNGTADKLLAERETLLRLPVPLLIDHMGQVPQPEGVKHPGFALLKELLANGRCWIKLSGAYLHSRTGPPGYGDAGIVAHALIDLAPDRMVWGSDWPHPTKKADEKPDDAQLLDLIVEWAPTDAVRRRILVDNPARLYGY